MVSRILRFALTATFLLAALSAAVFFNCSSARQNGPVVEESSHTEPLSLFVDRVIAGEVMGRRLSNPVGLAAARDGRVYVCDNGNDRVVMFDSTLTARREIGGRGQEFSQLSSPEYLALDNDLNLAVSETGNRRVSVFDR